jgi:hypothetical protein
VVPMHLKRANVSGCVCALVQNSTNNFTAFGAEFKSDSASHVEGLIAKKKRTFKVGPSEEGDIIEGVYK